MEHSSQAAARNRTQIRDSVEENVLIGAKTVKCCDWLCKNASVKLPCLRGAALGTKFGKGCCGKGC